MKKIANIHVRAFALLMLTVPLAGCTNLSALYQGPWQAVGDDDVGKSTMELTPSALILRRPFHRGSTATRTEGMMTTRYPYKILSVSRAAMVIEWDYAVPPKGRTTLTSRLQRNGDHLTMSHVVEGKSITRHWQRVHGGKAPGDQ